MSRTPDFDKDLLAVVAEVCDRARTLTNQAPGLPEVEVERLRRAEEGYLDVVTESDIAWGSLADDLEETMSLWERLTKIRSRALEKGEFKYESDREDPYREFGAHLLWDGTVKPLVVRYHAQRPNWEWDDGLARSVLEEWRGLEKAEAMNLTTAPLHNFAGPEATIEIEDGLAIRPLTDLDRELIWNSFGRRSAPTPLSPSIEELERWSHAIEYRWREPEGESFLFDHGTGVEMVRQVVNAVRLHHPGVTGTTLVWTRPDYPLDGIDREAVRQILLSVPDVIGSYEHPLEARLEADDAKSLADMLRGMREAPGDRRLALALRRFDSAYSRYEEEDSLIDLWIAFEALLLPERSELSYRVALRIARLVGDDGPGRQEAFKQARDSYGRRSQVVHGELVDQLDEVVEQTRELARRALRAWILTPPEEGVKGLDKALLA